MNDYDIKYKYSVWNDMGVTYTTDNDYNSSRSVNKEFIIDYDLEFYYNNL